MIGTSRAVPNQQDRNMTTELTVLTLAGLLQVIQFALMAIPANLELAPAKPCPRAILQNLADRS